MLVLVTIALLGVVKTTEFTAYPRTAGPGAAIGVTSFPTPIEHVVVVVLENAEFRTVLAQGPFESSLASTYTEATNMFAICHPSEPNYLALAAGDTFGRCGTDQYTVISATNIADLVEQKGETWGAFAESMPTACDATDSDPYVVKHNPFVFFEDIVSNASRCNSHVQDFNAWNARVASGTIPNYSFIIPNVLNDGHDTGVAFADVWLKGWLTPLMTKPWFNSTAFFITYDEGQSGKGFRIAAAHHAGIRVRGGTIYTAVVSPYTLGGGPFAPAADHYNTLTTIEWLLGLGSTGHHDDPALSPPMTGMFTFPRVQALESDTPEPLSSWTSPFDSWA